MTSTTRLAATVCIVAATAVVLASCASTSLHSPRPNPPGAVEVGLFTGYVFAPAVTSVEESPTEGAPVGNAILRIGLRDRYELGLNAGVTSVNLAVKHGLREYEDPFQLSLIGSAGLYLWTLPQVSVGVLSGVDVGPAHLYGGARGELTVGNAFYPFASVSLGAQLFPFSPVSAYVEYDRDIHFLLWSETSSEDDFIDLSDFGLASINLGASIAFGR